MAGTRYPIAETGELAEPGDRVIEEVRGREIAVFNVEGDYHAVANYCIHEAGPLCEGKLTGEYGLAEDGYNWAYDDVDRIIHCPWHNWKFDVTTGRSTDDPRYAVPTYDVEVEDGTVYVVMGR